MYIYIYGVLRCFWQGNHQIYGVCIYTVLANPTDKVAGVCLGLDGRAHVLCWPTFCVVMAAPEGLWHDGKEFTERE
jgi:hypothetical protein